MRSMMKSTRAHIILFLIAFLQLTNLYAQDEWIQGEFNTVTYGLDDLFSNEQTLAITQGADKRIYAGNKTRILVLEGNSWRFVSLVDSNFTNIERERIDQGEVKDLHLPKNNELMFVVRKNSLGYVQLKRDGSSSYRPIHVFDKAYKGVEVDYLNTYDFKNNELLVATKEQFYHIKGNKVSPFHFPPELHKAKCTSFSTFFDDYILRFESDANTLNSRVNYYILNKSTGEYTKIKLPEDFQRINFTGSFKFGRNFYLYSSDGETVVVNRLSNGSYRWNEGIPSTSFPKSMNGRISRAIRWKDYVVLAYRGKGLEFYNSEGKLVKHLSSPNDLISGDIHQFTIDHQNNIWLGTQQGIQFIELSSPISIYSENRGISKSDIYTIDKESGRFLVGTKSSFFIDSSGGESLTFVKNESYGRDVYNVQTFKTSFGKKVLFSPYDGIIDYNVSNGRTTKIAPNANIGYAQSKTDKNVIYAGNLASIGKITFTSQGAAYEKIVSTDSEVWGIIAFPDYLIYGVRGKGLCKLDLKTLTKEFVSAPDIPSSNSLFAPVQFGNKILVLHERKIFEFDEQKNKLVEFKIENSPLEGGKDFGLHALFAEDDKNLWVSWSDKIENKITGQNKLVYYFGCIHFDENGKQEFIQWPYYQISKDNFVFDALFESKNKIWFGGVNGLYFLDRSLIQNLRKPYDVRLKRVRIGNDSLIELFSNSSSAIDFEFNKIRVDFYTNSYYGLGNIQYSYQVNNEPWTPYSDEDFIELSKLSEGNYTVRIKAKDIYEFESKELVFEFKILPPWYRSWWAYLLYVAVFIGVIVLVSKISTYRVKIQNQRLEAIVKARTKEIAHQNKQLESQKAEITKKSNDILDSIKYAKRIQDTILPTKTLMNLLFEEHFVLFKPKDIVSGDFYWAREIDGKSMFAAVDCTGHGVPGALVSIVGNNGLIRATNEFQLKEPGDILNKLREIVKASFESEGHMDLKDGMDMALCSVDRKTMTLKYAGANNECVIIREKQIIQLQADKQPIGKYVDEKPFTQKEIKLEKNDCIYVFSDGYVDQFGGDRGKKFKSRPFRNFLAEISELPMNEQFVRINQAFEDWRGELDQIDDVCVFGVRV